MSDKHYTPEISEFHFGFEYEIYEDFDHLPKKSWHKQIYGTDGHNPEQIGFVSLNHLDKFRVKYLDRKDIEECGFEFIPDQPLPRYKIQIGSTKDGHFELIQSFHNIVKIMQGYEWVRFYGTIKNKSEFKKILKQVGITKEDKNEKGNE